MSQAREVRPDDGHPCPALGCPRRVPFEVFACRTHWFTITPPARAALQREFRRHFGEDSYFAARAACLRELGIPEDEIPAANGGHS